MIATLPEKTQTSTTRRNLKQQVEEDGASALYTRFERLLKTGLSEDEVLEACKNWRSDRTPQGRKSSGDALVAKIRRLVERSDYESLNEATKKKIRKEVRGLLV